MPHNPATLAPLLGEPLPVECMNTIWADHNGIHDALGIRGDALGWIEAVDPLPSPLAVELGGWLHDARESEADEVAATLCTLRDALRRLAAEQTADPRTRAASAIDTVDHAVDIVNRAAAAVPHWSQLEWSDTGPRSVSRSENGVGRAVTATIAEQAIDLFSGEARHELRACLAPRCVLY